MPLDDVTAAAVTNLVQTDDAFQAQVRKLSLLALQQILYTLQNGTPDARLQIAKMFLPVFTKALTGDEGNQAADETLAKTRELVGGMLDGFTE